MQKFISPMLASLILALWVSGIAILSVQNAAPISLKFIGFRSIEMPIGIILAFTVSLGFLIGGLFMPPLFNMAAKGNPEDF
ncbi:MAG: LapA family protein [Microcoleaceae cyanobacterium MO_207.B10]|nr:LapA family protein [Microcoleaceae cyanobacterium MO_207.B10]